MLEKVIIYDPTYISTSHQNVYSTRHFHITLILSFHLIIQEAGFSPALFLLTKPASKKHCDLHKNSNTSLQQALMHCNPYLSLKEIFHENSIMDWNFYDLCFQKMSNRKELAKVLHQLYRKANLSPVYSHQCKMFLILSQMLHRKYSVSLPVPLSQIWGVGLT